MLSNFHFDLTPIMRNRKAWAKFSFEIVQGLGAAEPERVLHEPWVGSMLLHGPRGPPGGRHLPSMVCGLQLALGLNDEVVRPIEELHRRLCGASAERLYSGIKNTDGC